MPLFISICKGTHSACEPAPCSYSSSQSRTYGDAHLKAEKSSCLSAGAFSAGRSSALLRRAVAAAARLTAVGAMALMITACSSSAQDEGETAREYAQSILLIKNPPAYNDFSSLSRALELATLQGYKYHGPFTPYTGSSTRIYGTTSAGCIAGADMLTDEHQDFQLQRWAKGRNYGHPMMMQYLQDLRARTTQMGLPPLLIGDISRSLGGPYGPRSNHASHNTGIDVDLPFDFAAPRKSDAELRNPRDVYIVRGSTIKPEFTRDIELYIKAAASDPRVDRIFVAPMIKKRMCAVFEGDKDNGFLRKLRPWFGHQAHMHVRLTCPFDSPECITQAPVPEGTGCGYELESWFLPPQSQPKTTARKKQRIMPAKCASLLKGYSN